MWLSEDSDGDAKMVFENAIHLHEHVRELGFPSLEPKFEDQHWQPDNFSVFENLIKTHSSALHSKVEEIGHLPLLRMLKSNWFSSIWTVQHITLAKEAVIYCGEANISWEVFAPAIPVLWGFATTEFIFKHSLPAEDCLYRLYKESVICRSVGGFARCWPVASLS